MTPHELHLSTAALALIGGCPSVLRVGGAARVAGAGDSASLGIVVCLSASLAESGVAPTVVDSVGVWEALVYATEVFASSNLLSSRVAQITHSVQAVALPIHEGYLWYG